MRRMVISAPHYAQLLARAKAPVNVHVEGDQPVRNCLNTAIM
jgi:hypothetical protein